MSKAAGRAAVAAFVAYDFGYGAFTGIVSTFVFPTYVTQAVAPDPETGAAQWAGAQAVAGVLIALLAVPFGALADQGGRRRFLLAAATSVMAAATFGLWFIRPAAEWLLPALVLAATATVAFEVATVFYNAMLPGLVAPHRLGRLSMLAWASGYAGALICLGLSLALLIGPDPPLFGLDRASAEPIRATALLAGAWLVLFTWPACVFIPDPATRVPWRAAMAGGIAELRAALRDAVRRPMLRRFLIARLFYMDGIVTLFAFGGIYASGEFGLSSREVLIFGIGLAVSAGVGATSFALIEDRIGAKTTVMVSLIATNALCVPLLLVRESIWFWILGLCLGLFVGPAQAASRSMMAHMAPPEARAAWFGLFALSGRVTAFLGPAAVGLAILALRSQRAGMAVIVLFLTVGIVLLARVKSPRTDI